MRYTCTPKFAGLFDMLSAEHRNALEMTFAKAVNLSDEKVIFHGFGCLQIS